jgi:hypothetical protein
MPNPNEMNKPRDVTTETNPGYPGGIKPGEEPDLKPGKQQPDGGEQSDLPGEPETREPMTR